MQNMASKIEKLMELTLSLNADIADQETYIHELEDKLSILNTIKEVNYYMGAELELKKIIQVIIDVVMGVLGVSVCAICLKNENGWDIKEHSILDNRSGIIDAEGMDKLEAELLKRRGEIIIPDLSQSEFLDLKEGSFIALPLMRGTVNYGIITVYYITPDALNEGKEEFFRLVSAQLGIHLENAFLFERIKRASITDGLTGLFNRLYLNERLHNYSDTDISESAIIMMDIDGFKKVNDAYGHLFGDNVLKSLAGVLKKVENKYGVSTFRYGGEEFLALCKNQSLESLSTIAEEIRAGFSNCRFDTDSGDTVNFSISLGVCRFGYSSRVLDITRMIDIADEALYYSKKTGKNRYTISTPGLQLYLKSNEAITKMAARSKRFKNPLILFKGEFDFHKGFSKIEYAEFMESVTSSFRIYDSILFNNVGGFICILEDHVEADQIRTRLMNLVKGDSDKVLTADMLVYNHENADLLTFFGL